MEAEKVLTEILQQCKRASILNAEYIDLIEKDNISAKRLEKNILEIFKGLIGRVQYSFCKHKDVSEIIASIAYFADIIGNCKLEVKKVNDITELHKVFQIKGEKDIYHVHMIRELLSIKKADAKGNWLINPLSVVSEKVVR